MDLEQLQKEAEKDLKIDKDNLDIESLKTPELYGKYLQIFIRWNLLSKQADSEYKKLLDKNGNTILVNQTQEYIKRNLLT